MRRSRHAVPPLPHSKRVFFPLFFAPRTHAHASAVAQPPAAPCAQAATGISDIDQLVKLFIENEDQNFKMFNYLNELNVEIEKGEEAISELKQESEKFRGQDKGAASQRKRLIKDLQDRAAEYETKTAQYEDSLKQLTSTTSQLSTIIETLCGKLGTNPRLLQDMGAEGGGCNESNIMVYLGVVEQRANELLSAADRVLQQALGTTNESYGNAPSSPGPSGVSMLGGPQTPQGQTAVSIAVPTTAEEYESEDSEEEDEHPLSRDELQAKTMRGLAKRESGKKPAAKAAGGAGGKSRGRLS